MKKQFLSFVLALIMVISLLPTTSFATSDWSGSGTKSNPYLIQSKNDLDKLADNVNAGTSYAGIYFKLTADINGFTKTIGLDNIDDSSDLPFSGHFDGDLHTVTLNITGGTKNDLDAPYAAMFGYVDGGEIKNVITAGTVTVQDHYTAISSYVCVAGVCASIGNGSIINCGNRANISVTNADFHGATSIIGGVCARCGAMKWRGDAFEFKRPNITNCYNTGDINVTYKNTKTEAYTLLVGGVCNDNYGQIQNCYNAGEVKITKGSDSSVASSGVASGGICSSNNDGTITYCYNSTSGCSNAGGGTGMTSDAMKTSDFVTTLNGNMGSGSKVMWTIDSATNKGYPYLICGFKITYEENDGSAVTDLVGQTKLPDTFPTTTKAGFDFRGWFTNSEKTTPAVTGDAISQDTTLYAKWIKHEFEYKAEENVITATCSNDGCDLPNKNTEGKGYVTLTLTSPAIGYTYNAEPHGEFYLSTDETTAWEAAMRTSAPAIEYYLSGGTIKTTAENSGAEDEGKAPVNAGTYVAKVTVTGADNATYSAITEFTIAKKNLEVSDLNVTADSVTYDSATHSAIISLKSPLASAGAITVKYKKQIDATTWGEATSADLLNAGVYKILVSAEEGKNFNACDLLDTGKTLTINKVTPQSIQIEVSNENPLYEETYIISVSAIKRDDIPDIPSGKIYIKDGSTTIASFVLDEDGTGRHTISVEAGNLLTAGAYSLTAVFEPDLNSNYMNSTSSAQTLLVRNKISFNSNGGSDVDYQLTTGYAIKPTNPTRSGFIFAGWYSDSVLKTAWNFDLDLTNSNLTLYAKWLPQSSNPVETSEGAVKNASTGAVIANARVELVKGPEVIASTVTDSEGKFNLGYQQPGDYNLVITDQGKVITTKLIQIKEGADMDLQIVEKDINTRVKIVADGLSNPNVVVGRLDAEGETQVIIAGCNKEDVTLTLKSVPADGSPEARASIGAITEARGKNLEFVDISILLEYFKDNALSSSAILHETTQVIEIIMPYDTSGRRDIKVFRYHDDGTNPAEVKVFTKLGARRTNVSEYQDGEYYVGDGYLVIYATKFSEYALAYSVGGGAGGGSGSGTGKTTEGAVFVDIEKGSFYYDAVLWAAENGITLGTDKTHFSPFIPITRAQVLTFLWRAAGCPEPNGDTSKFTDVSPNAYYAKAVAWGIENVITKGTTTTTFSPDMICQRAHIVTFLARFAGVKDEDTGYTHNFTDVSAKNYFNNSVSWAAEHKVTKGTTATTFEPYKDCSRAEVVTFLWRWMTLQ